MHHYFRHDGQIQCLQDLVLDLVGPACIKCVLGYHSLMLCQGPTSGRIATEACAVYRHRDRDRRAGPTLTSFS
jgi:hypothetical protein